ncbi:MAG: hypothetical protein JNL72_12300 [Flavipsychrobacter sp.]|nr:hypothetical protein [Flavipsychrobacter sp.]
MKKGYLFFLFFLLISELRAQDSVATPYQVDCDQVTYQFSDMATYYYGQYNDDSLQYALAAWEAACGVSEPLVSFKVLYAIEKGNFTETLYDENIVRYLQEYLARAEGSTDNYPNVPADYYQYLRDMAKGLKPLSLPPLERVLVDYYATLNEDVLDNMDSVQLSGTLLYDSYTAYKQRMYNLFGRFHISVEAGAWIPDGDIDVLGSHPLIGFQMGSQWKKISVDLGMSIRFTNAPNYYDVDYYGTTVSTNQHTGVYIGLDVGYIFKQARSHQFRVLGGIGYDAITVIRSTDEEQYNGKFLSSVNLNGGMSYRYYLSRKHYLGLIGKYNLLFFKNSGTSLAGNAFTISLAYGFH